MAEYAMQLCGQSLLSRIRMARQREGVTEAEMDARSFALYPIYAELGI